jgi:hypothetical protein
MTTYQDIKIVTEAQTNLIIYCEIFSVTNLANVVVVNLGQTFGVDSF